MQPYIDWETVEGRDCGSYKYQIMRVVKPGGEVLYKGFIVFSDNSDYWLENESRDTLRMSLMTMGTQR